MTERLPANLELLYGAFGREGIDSILPGDTITVGDVEFVCKYAPESTANRFFIVKTLELVERYRRLCAGAWKHARIVELGIAEGGSTALLALLAEPRKLVAVDIETQPLEALAEFIAAHGLGDSVRPHYGVDQANHRQLAGVVDDERGDELLDVVIDDASHDYFLTKASFETLFPRLRPGGVFVIEDWNAAHTMRDAVIAGLRDTTSAHHAADVQLFREAIAEKREAAPPAEVPLSRLAIELVLTRAGMGEAIESVTVDEYWVTVVRGHGALDPEQFSLGDLFRDYFGFLPALP